MTELQRPNPPAKRLPRLIAVGFQGFGNVGDEAILCGLERLLEGAATLDVIVAGTVAPVRAAPAARRIHPWKLLPTPVALRAIRRADAVVIAGGGLVNDYWPLVIPRYLAWVLATRLMGRPVVWAGVGVGPVRRRAWRLLAGIAFALSNAVVVRDRASEEAAAGLVPSARVQVAADPAFALSGPANQAAGSGVGVIVRSPAPGDERHLERLVAGLAATITGLVERGVRVDVLTMHPAEDQAIRTALREALAGGAGKAVQIDDLSDDPNTAAAALGSYAALVSARLHGIILGAVAGVPSVAIVYDAKVGAAAELLGLADVAIPLAELTSARIDAALATLADPSRDVEFGSRLELQRDRLNVIRDTLVKVVG